MKIYPYSLFVSFQSEQAAWVAKLVEDLQETLQIRDRGPWRPFQCFYDRTSIGPAMDWHEEMLAQVKTAHRFLFIVTTPSCESPWCILEREARIKLDGYATTLFVLKEPGLPFFQKLGCSQTYVDATTGEAWKDGRLKVIEWLCKPLEKETFRIRIRPGAKERQPPLTLNEVWQKVCPKVCLVSHPDSETPLGFAWRSAGNRFLSPPPLSHALQRLQGLRLSWTDRRQNAREFAITSISPAQEPDNCMLLSVFQSGPPPEAMVAAEEHSALVFADGEFLSLCYTNGSLQPLPVMVNEWNHSDEVEFREPVGDGLVAGAPIFDACEQLLGYLQLTQEGVPMAVPV